MNDPIELPDIADGEVKEFSLHQLHKKQLPPREKMGEADEYQQPSASTTGNCITIL